MFSVWCFACAIVLLMVGASIGLLIGNCRYHKRISGGFGHLTRISQHRALNPDDLVDAFAPRLIRTPGAPDEFGADGDSFQAN